jgi:hypothetical protein
VRAHQVGSQAKLEAVTPEGAARGRELATLALPVAVVATSAEGVERRLQLPLVCMVRTPEAAPDKLEFQDSYGARLEETLRALQHQRVLPLNVDTEEVDTRAPAARSGGGGAGTNRSPTRQLL